MKERLKELWESRPIRKLRRDRWALICLSIIVIYIVVAVLVKLGLFAGGFEERVGEKYLNPSGDSWKLWLGTDRQGRSIFVRTIYSANVAIFIGLFVALFCSVVGALLGAIAGFWGRRVDDLIVWLYSTVQSIPYLVLLIILTYVAGGGIKGIYVAMCSTFWVGPCRVVRGEVLKLREAEYVQSARAMGYGRWRILFRHVIPNTFHIILVYFALLFVGAIKSEVIISFLGLGVQGEPSWGIMISQARAELINGFYWQIGAATVAMFILVLSFNIFADALQDALDPKHQ
jgi:ABC-type dipeptide/oligopeptide/nickel transport system permease subunit